MPSRPPERRRRNTRVFRESTTRKEDREWIYKMRVLSLKERVLRFLMWTFGLALLVTVPTLIAVIFLDGFSVGGFDVSDEVIISLIGATLGEVAGLLGATITSLVTGKGDD